MELPKKQHKKRYNIVLTDPTREFVEKMAKETQLSMSEIIEYCTKYTKEQLEKNGKI